MEFSGACRAVGDSPGLYNARGIRFGTTIRDYHSGLPARMRSLCGQIDLCSFHLALLSHSSHILSYVKAIQVSWLSLVLVSGSHSLSTRTSFPLRTRFCTFSPLLYSFSAQDLQDEAPGLCCRWNGIGGIGKSIKCSTHSGPSYPVWACLHQRKRTMRQSMLRRHRPQRGRTVLFAHLWYVQILRLPRKADEKSRM